MKHANHPFLPLFSTFSHFKARLTHGQARFVIFSMLTTTYRHFLRSNLENKFIKNQWAIPETKCVALRVAKQAQAIVADSDVAAGEAGREAAGCLAPPSGRISR
ncbi:MAG TPA: hypothetical protein VIS73_11385 [Rhodocyclaceae bacterium]